MYGKSIQFIVIILILGSFMFVAHRLDQSGNLIYPDIYYLVGGDTLNTSGKSKVWSTDRPSESLYSIKSPVVLSEKQVGKDLQIALEISGSYKVFWNSELIGTNGIYSLTKEGEVPGVTYATFIIAGPHTKTRSNILYLKVSHHHRKSTHLKSKIALGNYPDIGRNVLTNSVIIHFLAGAFFVVSLYYAFLFFVSYRKPSFLIFSVLCLAGFLLILIGFSKAYLPIPYDWYDWRFWLFRLLSFSVALGMPVFLFFHFDLPHKSKFTGALLILSTAAWMLPDSYNWVALLIGFGAQFSTTIWAMFKQKPGSVEVLVGLLTFVTGFIYFNISIYLGFAILVIAILFSLSLSFREERRKQAATLLRSARLRTELLRKNIQPHFLLNTLTTIISLIEVDPKASIDLIHALSDEFRTLSEIADKKLISIRQELELCRSYLKVMSIRNDTKYILEQEITDPELKIPPAIIHTLIENGISHNAPINGSMHFEVSEKAEESRQIIEVTSNGLVPELSNEQKEAGTGISYIKARLEESFPQNWQLNQEKQPNYWRTSIIIKTP